MAKVIGVDTQIRGKMGARIYQVLYGEQIVKTMADPTNPRSTSQTTYRTRFSALIQGFKKIASDMVKPLWKPTLVGNQTPWGNFIGASLNNMASTTFDPEDVLLGQGSLEPLADLAGEYSTGTGNLEVMWTSSTVVNGANDDDVSFVVYDKDSETIVGSFPDDSTRDAESASLTIASGYTATSLVLLGTVHRGTIADDDITIVGDGQAAACTAAA